LSLVLDAGGTVFTCGNGGSAADAQHFAAELAGRFLAERRALAAVALPANPPLLTALGNDYGVEAVFARQIEALARPGDCVLAISTSGRSPNILEGLRAGRRRGALTIALTGPDGIDPSVSSCSDFTLAATGPDTGRGGAVTPHVQEVHLGLLHYVAFLVETSALNNLGAGPGPGPGRSRVQGRRPAVFLDRDGTLVEERGYIRYQRDLALLPGAGAAVRRLNDAGLPVVLTTNQSAVARGLIDEKRLGALHGRLRTLLAGQGGGVIDAVYQCIHHPSFGDGGPCACRKPLPGMMLRAAADLGLDLGSSYVIGDNWVDVQAAVACGAVGILVLTGAGPAALQAVCPLGTESAGRWMVASDLEDAVRMVLRGGRGTGQ
jgi:D-sedoheptulose 7-phosphate isomerase